MYLLTLKKEECCGCESCVQICARQALEMQEDEEGFRYPVKDTSKCTDCNLCLKACQNETPQEKHDGNKFVFGGYNNNSEIRFQSTSGGAFSAVAQAFCDYDYVVFGAEADGIKVSHKYITDISELGKFRKSKYTQSTIGTSYADADDYLKKGWKVLFSGTPCQIGGLYSYLKIKKTNTENLLTVEVICEGVPSPLYIRKLDKKIRKKYGYPIRDLDYRYTGESLFSHGKWDFEKMQIKIGEKTIDKDRWVNPFWSVWLQHLMSRPSCYDCMYTTSGRISDITLGDLWGVHIYCPELYGKNGGSSLVICNTEKGKEVFMRAQEKMIGHELDFDTALKYQGPLKKTISKNPNRSLFFEDLKGDMDYDQINKKWAKRPTVRLLFEKYIWGNRQKVFLWELNKKIIGKKWREDHANRNY